MLRKGGGVIVNITSIGSLQPDTWAGAYSASKAAVNALAMHIANAFTHTPWSAEASFGTVDQLIRDFTDRPG